MRIVAVALALTIVAGLAAPVLADEGEGQCPRAAQAAAMAQYLKSNSSAAVVPAVQTVAPTSKTTTTTESGG
jgi:hypothetical protein